MSISGNDKIIDTREIRERLDELKYDYTTVEYEGTTYYGHS